MQDRQHERIGEMEAMLSTTSNNLRGAAASHSDAGGFGVSSGHRMQEESKTAGAGHFPRMSSIDRDSPYRG